MKSKKLVSLLCAAAMTTSAFAGLVTTASAATESDILWSDTFNNAATGVFLDGTSQNAATNNTAVSGLTFVTTNRGSGDRGGYTATDGTYIYNGSYYAVNEKTDAADKYIRLSFPVFADFEKANANRWAYVALGESGYTATAAKDVVMDFDLKLTDGLDKGEKGANPVLRIGTFDTTEHTATAVAINKDTLSLGDDWVHARIIVSDSTGAKLYINGTEAASGANANVKSLATIGLYSADGQSNCGAAMADIVGNAQYDDGTMGDPTKLSLTPIADLDNVIIYNEAAGVATGTSAAPGAQSQEGGSTPAPVATAKVIPAAPELAAPDGVTGIQVYDFDSIAAKKWSLGTESTDDSTSIPGINLHIGARSDGGTVETYAAVTKIASGNAFQMTSAQYGTAGRAPRIGFTNTLPVSDNVSTALAFEVYISAVEGKEEDARPRLYFLKDTTQSGSDGAGAYRNVAAVLTTIEDEVFYRESGNTESDKISAYITPNEWHKVTFVITPGTDGNKHRVYIDDDYDNASITCNYVSYGENATTMEALPMLTVDSQAAEYTNDEGTKVANTPTYTLATIDNILAYQGEVDNPKKLVPKVGEAPTPAPTPVPKHDVTIAYDNSTGKATVSTTETEAFSGVLINAAYKTDGTLDTVQAYDLASISSAKAAEVTLNPKAVTGGKLMVWNSLKDMIPYGSLTVEQGEAAATPAPVVTPTPVPATDAPSTATDAPATTTDAPATTTDAPATTTDAPSTATEAPTEAPTAAPTEAPTPTPIPTYTVSGTVDANVASVTLTDSEDSTKTYAGTITGTAVSVADVPAGTYTITATGATGYTVRTITVGGTEAATVTVADADVTNVAITTIATATITADATYVNFFTDETKATDYRDAGVLYAANVKVADNEVQSNGSVYEQNNLVTIASFDASDYIGKVRSATLSVTGSASGNSTTARYGTFANYIDIDNAESVTASNLATLGGTAAYKADLGNIALDNSTTVTGDVTSVVRADEDGKITLFVFTSTGRTVTVTDLSLILTLEDAAIPASTVTIKKVYADSEGTITIGEGKYTAFGTDEEVTGLYSGDKYTPAATYKDAIDDETAYYKYVSGIDTVTLADGANTIYVVYDKTAYAATAFNVTIPAAAGEGGETVNVALAGTTTADTDSQTVSKTVAVTVAEGETTGTANVSLLPGTYTYKYTETNDYLGVDEKAVTVGGANDITLVANVKTPAAITVKYALSDSTVAKTVVLDAETSGAYVDTAFTLPTYDQKFDVVAEDKKTYKMYAVDSTATLNLTVTPSSADADANVITIPVTTDNVSYYANDDFESYAVDTDITKVAGFSGATSAIKAGATGQGKVLWLRGGGTWTAKTFEDTPVASPITGNVKFEFDIHYGYFGGGDSKNSTWTLKNSAETPEDIMSVKYNATKCNLVSITIGGVEQLSAEVSGYQDKNNYTDQNTKAHTTVVVDFNTNMAQVTLTRGDTTNTYKASIAGLTQKDIASWVHENGINNNDRCSTIDNFKVYATTDTVTAAE